MIHETKENVGKEVFVKNFNCLGIITKCYNGYSCCRSKRYFVQPFIGGKEKCFCECNNIEALPTQNNKNFYDQFLEIYSRQGIETAVKWMFKQHIFNNG